MQVAELRVMSAKPSSLPILFFSRFESRSNPRRTLQCKAVRRSKPHTRPSSPLTPSSCQVRSLFLPGSIRTGPVENGARDRPIRELLRTWSPPAMATAVSVVFPGEPVSSPSLLSNLICPSWIGWTTAARTPSRGTFLKEPLLF